MLQRRAELEIGGGSAWIARTSYNGREIGNPAISTRSFVDLAEIDDTTKFYRTYVPRISFYFFLILN